MKRYLIAGGALLAVVVLFFVVRSAGQKEAAAQTAFQTETLQRGVLMNMVGSTGTVRARQMATLAWQVGGQIEDILVEVGDTVEKGQVLAVLADDSLPQNIINAKADVVDARRALENLTDSDLSIKQAYQAYIEAQQEMEDAEENRESKDYQRASDAVIDEARANYVMAEDAVTDAEENFSSVEHLYEEDPVRAEALADLAKARQQRDDQQAKLNYLLSKPDELEISEADARIEVARAKLEDAEREWERVKNGVDNDEVESAEARLASIEALLDMAQLKAPFSGVITQVKSKSGDMVSAATVSFRIDDLSQLLVDVDISEVDINHVKNGQEVNITFDAILNQEYIGKVIEVAPVGNSEQGIVNFPVTIELVDDDHSVSPGMTAAVNIVTTRLEDVLLVPNRAFREVEGKRVVFLLKEGLQEAVPVEMGETSDSYSQVISGDIQAGDAVILNPQTAN